MKCFNNTEFVTDSYDIIGTDNKYFVQKFKFGKIVDSRGLTQISKFRSYFYEKLGEYIQTIDPIVQKKFRATNINMNKQNYTLLYYDKISTTHDEIIET